MPSTDNDGINPHNADFPFVSPPPTIPLNVEPQITDNVTADTDEAGENDQQALISNVDRDMPAVDGLSQLEQMTNDILDQDTVEEIPQVSEPSEKQASAETDESSHISLISGDIEPKRPSDDPNPTDKANATPIISIETRAPTEINAGQSAPVKITVRNLGETTAHGVIVQSSWTGMGESLRCDPEPDSVNQNAIQFPARTIEPNCEDIFTFELVAEERGDIEVTADVSFDTRTQSRIRVVRPELALEYLGPNEIKIGMETACMVELMNKGDGPAESVRLEVVKAEGLAIHVPRHPIEHLMPGESRNIPITVIPEAPGPVKLEFTAHASDTIQADLVSEIHVLAPRIKVNVQGPHNGYLRRAFGYTISVLNEGDMDAEGVQIQVTVPPGLEIVEWEKAGTHDQRTHTLSWALRKIAVAAGAEVSFRATVIEEGHHKVEVVAEPDVGISGTAEQITKGNSRADLAMSLEYDHGQLEVGEAAEFSVSVRNLGTDEARNVEVSIALPDGLQPGEAADGVSDDQDLSFSPFTLAADDQRTLRFTVIGEKPGEHVVPVLLGSESVTRRLSLEESLFVYDPAAQ